MDAEFLTIDEVADLLRVSSDTIYRLAARGEIGGRKVGRIWRIPKSAVEQYLGCNVPAGASSTPGAVVNTTRQITGGPTQEALST